MSVCTARGRHGVTVEAVPLVMDDDTVNVQHVCIDCELTVATTSWTREAWDEEHVMSVCKWAKCVALATVGEECAAHAAGYRQHDGSELRCGNCRKLLRKDEWYQLVARGQRHIKACVTHPDILAERAKLASA